MKESQVIKNLHSFKSIGPDSAWRNNNRSVLLSQINSGQTEVQTANKFWQKLEVPFIILRGLPQPVAAVFMILAFFASSALSMYAARDSKPGETLYLAKKAGERTQLVLAFSQEKKLKLGLEFAGERAREINQILESDGGLSEQNMVKLVNDFKNEINIAKERVEKIAKEQTPIESAPASAAAENGAEAEAESAPADEGMFTAGLEKEDKGIETSEAAETPADPVDEAAESGLADTALTMVVVGSGAGSTSPEQKVSEQQAIVSNVEKNISDILNKEVLASQEELSALSAAIDQLGVVQVKGASSSAEVIREQASSTAE